MPNKYEFDAVRWCGSMKDAHFANKDYVTAENFKKTRLRIEALEAELAALKEAARPVVEWWEAYGRFMDGKGPIPNPVLSVLSKTDICRVSGQQLDALAALVGEG